MIMLIFKTTTFSALLEVYPSNQDLPSLIFDFANFKPVKNNLRGSNLDQAKDRIA